MRINVLGVGFDNITAESAQETALNIIRNGEKAYIVTPNPEIVLLCRSNPALKYVMERAALVLPDGIGITLGAKLLGTPFPHGRITGIDFTERLIAALASFGGRVYLFGAKPGVAETAGLRLCEKYPGLIVAGVSDGYFDDDTPVIKEINLAEPDLLLVCIGAPKQENWMAENLDRLNVNLCIGLGGVLDVFSGAVRRAPVFMRKFGLEWLYRLIREPRRIKRMIKLPLFVFAVIWQRVRGKMYWES